METEGTIMVQASDFSYYGHLTSHKQNGNIKLQMYHNELENQNKFWKLYNN
jgi:hypothetical protein